MRAFYIVVLAVSLAGCAANRDIEFVPSKKSAVELRAAQTRLVPGDADTVMRGVVATLHDLGYRITKVESDAGTVSATRLTALRMAVVVRPRSRTETVVRANATIMAIQREGQVDSPEFYARDFFDPLGATLQRNLATLAAEELAPDPVRPVGEINTEKERQAAASRARPATGAPK